MPGRRPKGVPSRIHFRGRYYVYRDSFHYKAEAEQFASSLMDDHYVRVKHFLHISPREYAVYVRRKKR